MTFFVILLAVVFLATLLSPWLGVEDRPAFKRPDRKPRLMVGPPWK